MFPDAYRLPDEIACRNFPVRSALLQLDVPDVNRPESSGRYERPVLVNFLGIAIDRSGGAKRKLLIECGMAFNPLLELSDTHPALANSPLIGGLEKTFAYNAENGPIGLTSSGAFKRVFVQWAAEAFDWPGHRPADLYAVNKVLNEWDFFLLVELHDIMLALKLGRHFNGEFRLTPFGKTFVRHLGRLFGLVAPFYLFRVDHARHSRLKEERLFGNWDIFLNVINVEEEGGISAERLREVLYGPPDPGPHYDPIAGQLYVEILRPLCWLGLLQVVGEERIALRNNVYAKTLLWRAALRLDTDASLCPIVKH